MENLTQHSKVFSHNEPTIQWFRTGVFVRAARMGERIEKIKGVDNFNNDWTGEGKIFNNTIVEVISKVMIGPNSTKKC